MIYRKIFWLFTIALFLALNSLQSVQAATNSIANAFNFQEHVIEEGSSFHGTGESAVVDFDHDADTDLIRLDLNNAKYYWHENDGNQNFIQKELTIGDGDATKLAAHSFAVADVDRDGDNDIVAVGNKEGPIALLAWYENDGSNLALPTVHEIERTDATLTYFFWSVMAIDFDKDSDIDILTSTYDGYWSGNQDRVILFENDGSQNFSRKVISLGGIQAANFAVDDIDNDGDNDVVSSYLYSYYGGEDYIYWYKNNGIFPFVSYLVGEKGSGLGYLNISDLDNDGFKDIVSVKCDLIWYKGSENQIFIKNVIEEGLENCLLSSLTGSNSSETKLLTSDINVDGSTDIITSRDVSVSFNDKLLIYQNMGSGVFAEKVRIDNGGWGLFPSLEPNIGDIDSDGDVDIVARSETKLSWFENLLPPPPIIDLSPANLTGVKLGNNQIQADLDVSNSGNTASGEFKVALFVSVEKDPEKSTKIGEIVVSSLASGETRHLQSVFNKQNLDKAHFVGAIVDFYRQIEEIDETNNKIASPLK